MMPRWVGVGVGVGAMNNGGNDLMMTGAIVGAGVGVAAGWTMNTGGALKSGSIRIVSPPATTSPW
jgi:hypothetical protein